MAFEELKKLPIWQHMVVNVPAAEAAMVERHLDHILPLLEHYADTFPNYTLHNREHILNILRIMSSLLGEAVNNLTGLEAMVLVLSAVYHDLGMVYSDKELEAVADTETFRKFLGDHAGARLQFEENGKQVSEHLLQWYCRWAHAERVWGKLQEQAEGLGHLTWRDVPIRDGIGWVCESHNEPAENIRVDDKRFQTNYLGDCDLRFCALLLRLADILDFDNSRSPLSVYELLEIDTPKNSSDEVSKNEWQKHMASRGFKFDSRGGSDPLFYLATPTHPYIEQGIRSFIDLIDAELTAAAGVVSLCGKRWASFNFPTHIDRSGIKSNNYVTGEYRFSLSEDKILDLLTGNDLYGDDYVFIRELLQNAIDTVRHRVFVERITNPHYTPEPIQVSYFQDAEGYHWLRIDDYGMGMNMDIVNGHLLKKGNSYYSSDLFKLEKLKMQAAKNQEFVPISRFGIGLLSCFMTCDRLEISTNYFYKAKDGISEKNRLSIENRAGFWVIRSEKEHHTAGEMPAAGGPEKQYRKLPGTSIACRFKTAREYQGVNMESIIDRYLLAPEIPVVYEGNLLGGDFSEIALKPWCDYSCTALPPKFVKDCADLLKADIESIEVIIESVDVSSMSATENLKGQLVIVVPLIKVKDLGDVFSLAKHFRFDDNMEKTVLTCHFSWKDEHGKDVSKEIHEDVTGIIQNIKIPDKIKHNVKMFGGRIFGSHGVSHNGIVVHDNEDQFSINLPLNDDSPLYRSRYERNSLYTGVYCFKDNLLPQVHVSRNSIKVVTAEIIGHVLYATRQLNQYAVGGPRHFDYMRELEGKRWYAQHVITVGELNQMQLFEKDPDFWLQMAYVLTGNGYLSIKDTIILAQEKPIALKPARLHSPFLTTFYKYIILCHFGVKYVPDEEGGYFEGTLLKEVSPPSKFNEYVPMSFVESDDSSKVVVLEEYYNAAHGLWSWFIANSVIIRRDYSYYGYQLIQLVLNRSGKYQQLAGQINDILNRLRKIMPKDNRPPTGLVLTAADF